MRSGLALAACGLTGAAWANDNAAKGPAADGTLPSLVKIAGEGEMNSHAMDFLTQLSDDVGARVTGSAADHKAEDWGVAKMNEIGLANVHKEKYTIWKGWTRGTADAELLTPVRHKLHIDSMGWTGSTVAGGIDADVVAVNLFDIDNEIKNVSRLKGKVVLMVSKGKPDGRPGIDYFIRSGDFNRAAASAGVVAVIGGQGGRKSTGMNLTHTGILGFDADFQIPVVSMTRVKIRASSSAISIEGSRRAFTSIFKIHLQTAPPKPRTSSVKFAEPSIRNKYWLLAATWIRGICHKAPRTTARARRRRWARPMRSCDREQSLGARFDSFCSPAKSKASMAPSPT